LRVPIYFVDTGFNRWKKNIRQAMPKFRMGGTFIINNDKEAFLNVLNKSNEWLQAGLNVCYLPA